MSFPILKFLALNTEPVTAYRLERTELDVIHDGKEYYLFDVGLAVENMLLAATDLGLLTHPMTAVHEDELKKVLHIPGEVRFVVATPLAYPAEGSYEKAARERLAQRTRKSAKEVVYSNAWGKPF